MNLEKSTSTLVAIVGVIFHLLDIHVVVCWQFCLVRYL